MVKKSRFLYVVLLVLLIIVAIGFVYNTGWAKNSLQSFIVSQAGQSAVDTGASLEQSKTPKSQIAQLKDPLNILVVGIDKASSINGPPRPGPWRADVIILVQVDPDREQVSLLSIPRDTRTSIPGHGMEKIAHAHAYGAMPLTVAAVEELMGVRIDHYMSIDYVTFARMVDILGGIEIDVPRETITYHMHFKPGKQLMDGRQAYEYIHSRDEPQGDIARIERQQLFLRTLLETVREQAGGLDLAKMYLEYRKGSEISLSFVDMLKLALFTRELKPDNLIMHTLPGKPDYINGISYWVADQEGLETLRFQLLKVES
ncbi:cell envelope-related function transcriptional attenuator common domain protein [Desulfoscipio gibsoniae DSM 7213]|uniref:Cell envelope-related function transcriptional attenuator common domain protein n=1 Tax=Desulfoscipio gibsoniae DSM 7213 TaxID=767817 RepID=R4KQW7_9FIRM|nr:cell envelope-related function transcriptional attenuator common domain protein [Desulfoscipio gibsoniae DSM 7213]